MNQEEVKAAEAVGREVMYQTDVRRGVSEWATSTIESVVETNLQDIYTLANGAVIKSYYAHFVINRYPQPDGA